MKNYQYSYICTFCLIAGMQQLQAQGPGSVETDMGLSIGSGGTNATAAETIYIGPGTYQVDGTWEIYSKYAWISPDAVITGAGTIKFFNPSDAGGAASATLADGNNNAGYINVNVELHNAGSLTLADYAAPDGSDWADLTNDASLTINKNFQFSVANGNVELDNYDMVTATTATLSGYQSDRFVVTNGTGHLVHNNYTGAFIYPVGIAAGDYSPASINSSAANTFHVLVQNYAASPSTEAGANGIDRTWNIYAGNASGNADINLQHNLSTDQASFNNTAHFVTRYGVTSPNTTGDNTLSATAWQSNTFGTGTIIGSLTTGSPVANASERSRVYTNFATSADQEIGFYSKSSNQIYTLPLKLLSFTATVQQCNAVLTWNTTDEINIDHFEIEYSDDGNSFNKIGQMSILNNLAGSRYTFTDAPPYGNVYYRLKLVSTGGESRYSGITAVRINCNIQPIVLYPNPTHGRFSVRGLEKGQLIQVYNATGQMIVGRKAENSLEKIDLSNYTNGVYNVIVINKSQRIFSMQVENR